MKKSEQKDAANILGQPPAKRKSKPLRKRSGKSVDYGLTAVTLGEVLKDQLDEAVAATKENRSEILRRALERYLENVPEMMKQREELRNKLRDRVFIILLFRIVREFEHVLQSFDYDGAFPDDLFTRAHKAVVNLEEWLRPRIPEGDGSRYQLPRGLEEAVSHFIRGSSLLGRNNHGKEWHQFVESWRREFRLEEGSKIPKEETRKGD